MRKTSATDTPLAKTASLLPAKSGRYDWLGVRPAAEQELTIVISKIRLWPGKPEGGLAILMSR